MKGCSMRKAPVISDEGLGLPEAAGPSLGIKLPTKITTRLCEVRRTSGSNFRPNAAVPHAGVPQFHSSQSGAGGKTKPSKIKVSKHWTGVNSRSHILLLWQQQSITHGPGLHILWLPDILHTLPPGNRKHLSHHNNNQPPVCVCVCARWSKYLK